MNGEFIFVGIIFILIMFVSTYGSSKNVVPYSFSSSKLSLYPYEGFSGDQDLTPLSIDPQKQTDTSYDIPRSEILSGSSLSHSSSIIDPISKLPGSASCIGNSAGLTNSLGGICLDPATIQQIKTRGNNFS
jgi:hypothetical protein